MHSQHNINSNLNTTSTDLENNIGSIDLNLSKQFDMQYAEALHKNNGFVSLNLDYNKISTKTIKPLCEAIRKHPALYQLSLEGNSLGDEEMEAIATLLSENDSLVNLNLRNNCITDKGIKIICSALTHNTCLEQLNLSENILFTESAFEISKLIKANNTIISLSLGDNFGPQGLQLIAEALEKNTVIVDLNLETSHAQLLPRDRQAQESITHSRLKITNLIKDNNATREKFITALLNKDDVIATKCLNDGISLADINSGTLLHLFIKNYDFGIIKFFRSVLPPHRWRYLLDKPDSKGRTPLSLAQSLSKTDLYEILIVPQYYGKEGWSQMLNRLYYNDPNFTELNYSYNNIDDRGIIELCNDLEKNEFIRILNLSHNNFGEIGINKICWLLKNNFHLTEIDLNHNLIDPDNPTYKEILFLLQRNRFYRALLKGDDTEAINSIPLEDLEKFKWSAVEIASKRNHPRVMATLIKSDRDANYICDNGKTLLLNACSRGHLDIVRFLLQKNANLNVDFEGVTPLDIAKFNNHFSIVHYIKTFIAPLPEIITLSPKTFVLIRMWEPQSKGKSVSYLTAILKSMLGESTSNVGHISIYINDNNSNIYASHWPNGTACYFTSVNGATNTLSEDLGEEGENAPPSVYVPLFSLNIEKMIECFRKIAKDAPWFLFGNKGLTKDKLQGKNTKAFNCSSFVYEILVAGGLFDHLLKTGDRLSDPMTPIDVANLAKKARLVETTLYPETEDYMMAMLNDLKTDLLHKSCQGLKHRNDFYGSVPDFDVLYRRYLPNNLALLKEEEQIIIDQSIRKEMEKNSQSLLSAMISLEDVNKKNGTTWQAKAIISNERINELILFLLKNNNIDLSAKNADGYNALHIAIAKENYHYVELLLEKFPYAINYEITGDNENINITNTSQSRFFPSATDKVLPLTPLDLALDTGNDKIINLLKNKGAIAKNRQFQKQANARGCEK